MSQKNHEKTEAKKAVAPAVVEQALASVKEDHKEIAEVAATQFDAADWGVQALTSRDIVIPKILAMQPMSKKVTAGGAKFGEFRDSLNDTVLGDLATPIEFVPFYMEKVWVIFTDQGKKNNPDFKFTSRVPITKETENLDPFEEEHDSEGRAIRRFRTMDYFVLLPKEIQEGGAIPYILSFRSSSARAGQKLATTMFMKNIKAGKTPAAMTMQLIGTKETNDKGTFVVMDVKELRPSTNTEIAEAFEWVKTVRGGNVKVDTSDLASEVASSTAQDAAVPVNTDF